MLKAVVRRAIRWLLPLVDAEVDAARATQREEKRQAEERYLHDLHRSLLALSEEEVRTKIAHDPHLLLRYLEFRKQQRV